MNQVLKEIGEELASAREHKGLKIEQLANKLKIRHRYLLAIERGELEELPVSAYVIGYLRSYANALGLSGDAVITRFKEGNDTSREEDVVLPEPNRKEMRPLPLILLVSLVAAVSLYVYWYKESNEVQSKIAMAVENFRQNSNTSDGNEGGEKSDTQSLPATLREADSSKHLGGNSPYGVVVVSDISEAIAPGAEIVLFAKGTTWIQLLTKDNKFLLEKKLHPGESYNIPIRDDLVVRSGEANSVEIYARKEGKDALLGTLAAFSQSLLPTLSPASGMPVEE